MMSHSRFYDRMQAGQLLADQLQNEKTNFDLVLALPRGGVPVGFVISKQLKLPLDIFLVRKLGVPNHPELAMGAIAMGGITYYNQSLISSLNISDEEIKQVEKLEQQELKRRVLAYRGKKPLPVINHKNIILADDGIATGATVMAAIQGIKIHRPKSITLAVPVAAQSTLAELSGQVDEICCPLQPVQFGAVGFWYEHFAQINDEEVQKLLSKSSEEDYSNP